MPKRTQPHGAQAPSPQSGIGGAEPVALPGRMAGQAAIVSASYRTDIPCFHAAWFEARLKAGFARVRNPYGGTDRLVRLDPESARAFVFWTRNPKPFMAVLEGLAAAARPFVVQMTITGYPRALEAATLPPEAAVAALRALARRFGPRSVVWRYDPILATTLTPASWHVATFAALARALEGAVDEAVISFVEPYRKTRRNMDAAAREHGFGWRTAAPDARLHLAGELNQIAARHGMTLTVCGADAALAGHAQARCIDAGRLSDVAGCPVPAGTRSHRPGCACAQSVDIGAYDTCAQGCAYCYAVTSRTRAKARLARIEPDTEFLGWPPDCSPASRAGHWG